MEVIAAAETWLDWQPSEFFLTGLQKLQQQAERVVLGFVGVWWINTELGHCSLFPSWLG
jgi:hypothetical protein